MVIVIVVVLLTLTLTIGDRHWRCCCRLCLFSLPKVKAPGSALGPRFDSQAQGSGWQVGEVELEVAGAVSCGSCRCDQVRLRFRWQCHNRAHIPRVHVLVLVLKVQHHQSLSRLKVPPHSLFCPRPAGAPPPCVCGCGCVLQPCLTYPCLCSVHHASTSTPHQCWRSPNGSTLRGVGVARMDEGLEFRTGVVCMRVSSQRAIRVQTHVPACTASSPK